MSSMVSTQKYISWRDEKRREGASEQETSSDAATTTPEDTAADMTQGGNEDPGMSDAIPIEVHSQM